MRSLLFWGAFLTIFCAFTAGPRSVVVSAAVVRVADSMASAEEVEEEQDEHIEEPTPASAATPDVSGAAAAAAAMASPTWSARAGRVVAPPRSPPPARAQSLNAQRLAATAAPAARAPRAAASPPAARSMETWAPSAATLSMSMAPERGSSGTPATALVGAASSTASATATAAAATSKVSLHSSVTDHAPHEPRVPSGASGLAGGNATLTGSLCKMSFVGAVCDTRRDTRAFEHDARGSGHERADALQASGNLEASCTQRSLERLLPPPAPCRPMCLGVHQFSPRQP
mmetsp:Transcript_95970/g.311246  ORF Transcript_95970/g.311246 Transcript_95970/m.311246 type:complete len:287 (-) Transcript_95970:120-980(-)